MFHVILLICAYFKTVSYYFCVSGIDSTSDWRITYFICVEVFGFLKIFILCLSLSLNSRKNQGKMPPGKIVSWRKAS